MSSIAWPSAYDIVNAFIAGPTVPGTPEPVLGVEWTLRREMLFYSIFSLVIWQPRFGGAILFLWFFCCIGGAFADLSYPFSFIFSPVHLLFGIGILVGLRVVQNPLLRHDYLIAATGVLIFIGFWVASSQSKIIHHSPFTAWGYGVSASCMILGFISMEQRGILKVARILSFLGDASYSIYLFHALALSAALKLTVILSRHVHLPALIWWMLISILAIGGGIAFHLIIERPILKIRSAKRQIAARPA
jgi:peptidoglycan/LPS O-acetylase OafA/YrhL